MFVIIGILGQTNKVEAALQSNGGTPLQANLNDWVYYTRQMQATGGTLGLTDTINEDLTSSNKNLDIHMQKNTEYGAMTILSASAYGNPNKIEDGGTTTGNDSGIQIRLNNEWTAAGPSNTKVGAIQKGKLRYWNNYGTQNGSNSKAGDAMAETSGWHGSTASNYLYHACFQHGGAPGGDGAFVRGGGSVFGFSGRSYNCGHIVYTGNYAPFYENPWCADHGLQGYHAECQGIGMYTKTWSGRAVVVVGSGI